MAPITTGHNLIQVLTAMRNFGVGVHVRRSVWNNPGCYWRVTRIKPSIKRDAYTRGKAWGQFYWNYRPSGKETRIHSVFKKQWMLDAEQPSDLAPELLRTSLQPPPPHIAKHVIDPVVPKETVA